MVIYALWAAAVILLAATALLYDRYSRLKSGVLDALRDQKRDLLTDYGIIDRAAAETQDILASCLEAKRKNSGRGYIVQKLRSYLESNPHAVGHWVVFEPNAFDTDAANKDNHDDGSGRFNTYVYRDGDTIKTMSLPDIDAEEFYTLPKQRRELVVLDPFTYDVDGTETLMTTVAAPIMEDNKAVGAAGVDVPLKIAKAIHRELLTLPGRSKKTVHNPLLLLEKTTAAIKDNYTEMAHQIHAQSDILSEAIEQSSSTMHELQQHTEVVEQQGEQSEENIESLNEVASAMSDVASVSQNMAESVETLARISVESADEAEVGAKAMEETAAAMDTVLDFAEAIKAIAEQTNLLALNASIEAARAGAEGRGFAVVAEEVTKLAAQSNKAASDAKGTIAEVRSQAERSLAAVRSIAAQAEKLDKHIQGIAAEIQEQSATAEEVSATVDQVLVSIKETTARLNQSIKDQEQAIQDTVHTLESLEANGRQFKAYAAKLQS